jgi:hypothetical protein
MLNESQLGDIWLLFSDFMDKKQVESAAERYVDLLADYGVTDRVLSAATGVDPVLDQAIDYYLDEEEIDADEEDEDNGELEF